MRRQACLILLVNDDDHVLAVARRGTQDAWGLPGGKVDPGEDLIDCARRELREETGVHAHSLTELYRDVDDDGFESITFLADGWTGDPVQGDAGPVDWITWDTLTRGPFPMYNTAVRVSYRRKQHSQTEAVVG